MDDLQTGTMFRNFIRQTKSATMLNESDSETWTDAKWDLWRLQVRAEVAAGGDSFRKYLKSQPEVQTAQKRVLSNAKPAKPKRSTVRLKAWAKQVAKEQDEKRAVRNAGLAYRREARKIAATGGYIGNRI